MSSNDFDPGAMAVAWCPGCGKFGIRKLVMEALAEDPDRIAPELSSLVSDMRQAIDAATSQ